MLGCYSTNSTRPIFHAGHDLARFVSRIHHWEHQRLGAYIEPPCEVVIELGWRPDNGREPCCLGVSQRGSDCVISKARVLHVKSDEIAIRRLENVADGRAYELIHPKTGF